MGCKELETTEQLNRTDVYTYIYICVYIYIYIYTHTHIHTHGFFR